MNQKVINSILAILFILTVVGIALAANNYQTKIQQTPNESSSIEVTDNMSQSSPDEVPEATTATAPIATSSPVVVIKSKANLPTKDVTAIQEKVIDPYIEYYKGTGDTIASITVEKNTLNSAKEYPYKFDAIFTSGVNNGFLISSVNGEIDWWVPECMTKCEFSEEFKEKYPEIIKKSETK